MKFSNQKRLYCSTCFKKTYFEIEGNIKRCSLCTEKTSWKHNVKRRWRFAKSEPDILGEESSPYFSKLTKETENRFDEIVAKMPLLSQREYEVIQLLWEGKTQIEVSQILSIDPRNVSSLLNRARKKLI